MKKPIEQLLRQLFNNFAKKRMPKGDRFELSPKNTYVFFSRQGYLFLLLLVLTFITGVNYANNLILAVFFYLASIWFVSLIFTFFQLHKLTITLSDVQLGAQNGLIWVKFALQNNQGKPIRQIQMHFDKAEDELITTLSQTDQAIYNEAYRTTIGELEDKTQVLLPIIADKRGQIPLPRLTIKTTYPLGITKAWAYGYLSALAWAYPRPLQVEYHPTKTMTANDAKIANAYKVGQDDFDRLDMYIEGEGLSRVSWTHVARGMGMLTKHFADPVGREQVVDYQEMNAPTHEEKLSQMAYTLLQMPDNMPFMMVLPSDKNGQSALGQGQNFINQCLLRLAQEP